MRVTATIIPDVLELEPEVLGDQRGYFLESFRQDVIEESVGRVSFVQDNESKSRRGVLRGLHFQKPPYTQSKLVRVVSGRVLDVALDIRIGSPWYGRHVACELDGERKNMLWVPKGFAHGFVVLSDEAVFAYKCDNYYMPSHEGGIHWNDPALGIDWKLDPSLILVSARDSSLPGLSSADSFRYEEFSADRIYRR
ncbi:dTDP-4-dehydrorhamnose 3,5-epimerase [Pelodictyon luteolum]|uniref:dTDP-4-dehydrorhamnose 3,5-epimerase n=1 Tax=Chlorobium luteolum (strain DSM 273 / BCRC 81028 / 2530) TaxID=319225 RepID=Q3B5S6_CHLL3|nr:dTDP-4-dehydrorhamnose 3,5-epimerase [Pelodictyon luteolum]ABB23305.1 dTDP-4-dehydrorhamnose 3,5-epimerase [Pelodictyon luteolum DSM 273]